MSVVAVILQYSEARALHASETGGNQSDLLPETGKSYYVRTFKNVDECKVINKAISVSGAINQHSEFNMSCDDIWHKALLIDSISGDMQLLGGFSVVTVYEKERYYPIITTMSGELSFPGGFATTYDYTVMGNDDALLLNHSLREYGIK
nr:hypothetical protein [Vibrio splendidus]MCC4883057.1 hypothetical protein [Vibrio splendidus]